MREAIQFTPVGALFDVDDTLLDNFPTEHQHGLHEYARLLAMREIGDKYGIPGLSNLSEDQNRTVLKRANEHSIEGNTWQLFYELGLVESREIDHSDSLLKEVTERKHRLYEPVLREFGAPLPRALEFIKAIYVLTNGKIAIASGARGKDVGIFLQMSGMSALFEDERVISREKFVRAKPHPESFETAFSTLGLSDSERSKVLAFEDDPKGVISAKNAGLFVCAITSRFDEKTLMTGKYKPDLVRESYVDFAIALGIDL